MKIQIIGYSGSGKSTLAKQLSLLYKLPLLYMDNVQFYDNWKERSLSEQQKQVQTFLTLNTSWVIDGNYMKVVPERFEACDLLIFLNFSRWFCFFSCLKRYLENKGKMRESCLCKEKFDLEFQKWILWEGRRKKYRKNYERLIHQYKYKSIVFHNRKQVDEYIHQLEVGNKT